MQLQAQPAGIAALYQGNAAPMQNPGMQNNTPAGPNPGIPPDLKNLLAQQARNEMAQAAQRYQALQQALQMGQGQGKPPTVAQQVAMQSQKAMAENVGPTMQAQEQSKQAGVKRLMDMQRGAPANPPQPEEQGIAALPVEEFAAAGGGIVAFEDGGTTSQAMEDIAGIPDWLREWWAGLEANRAKVDTEGARSEAARQAMLDARQKKSLGAQIADYFTAPKQEYAERFNAPTPPPAPPAQASYSNEGRNYPAPAAVSVPAPMPRGAAPTGVPPSAVMPRGAAPTGVPPSAVMPKGPVDPLDALREALPKDILEQMSRKEDDEYKKAAARYEDTLGLKALLAEKEGRITAREAREAAARAQRVPTWATGAMGMPVVRGGIGSLLGAWGAGTQKAQAAYSAADLSDAEKIDALRDTITQAKLEGNKGKVAAGEAALKNMIDEKNAARTAGTSMLNTAENAKARMQAAKDAAAARIAAAHEGKMTRASDAEQRVFATQSNQALQRATAIVAAEEKAAETSMRTNPIPAEDRIMMMYTKFLRTSLPPSLQHMAPAEYKPSGFTSSPTGQVRTLQVPGKQ